MPRLCPRGRRTVKKKFLVYPSAYANGYAVQVCKGTKPDDRGVYRNDFFQEKNQNDKTDLRRWFREEWVDVCNNMAPCGRPVATADHYPYCRPLHKLPGTRVKTVQEYTPKELRARCAQKRKTPFQILKFTGK